MERKVWVADLGRKNLALRWIDPITGIQRQKSAKTSNRKQAEKLAAQLEADLNKGRYAEPSRTTWEEFRERYTDEKLASLAPKTAAAAGTALNHIEAIVQPKRVGELSAAALSLFQAGLRKKGLREASIAAHLRHVKAALSWAKAMGIIQVVPAVVMPRRARGSKLMKGRPITTEEFERMLARTADIVGNDAAPSWREFQRGLWWSGLRLGEALELYWDRSDRLCVDLTGRRPMLRIPAELEKGHKDRVLPMAPEFAEFLMRTSREERRGRVFKLIGCRGQETADPDWVSRVISRIGKKATVKVDTDTKTGKVKFASAHDFRRAFGERWSDRVMPKVLKELMRHEDIATTMKYYVGHNAERTADALWSAIERLDETGAGSAGVGDGAEKAEMSDTVGEESTDVRE